MKTLLHNQTYKQQSNLATYCRTGELHPIIGLIENRVHHYRRLVYNVVDDTLRTAFPLTLDLLEENEWNDLVENFFANHACQSTSVWQMPKEFYEYVMDQQLKIIDKYPFLFELLLFEWIEIELYMMEDKIIPNYKSEGNIESDRLVFNPEFVVMNFAYPFHLKNPNAITETDKGNYYLLIFRDIESGEVHFIDISYLFAWIILKINETKKSLKEIGLEASLEFNIEYDLLIERTKELFSQLHSQKFILGFNNE